MAVIMGNPKFHHYVPRFYLAKFCNKAGQIWVYDKFADKVFSSSPEKLAGQNGFYHLDELKKDGLNPLELEKQFSDLEYQASQIIHNWEIQVQESSMIVLPEANRDIIALYTITQFFRTVEARKQLVEFASKTVKNYDAKDDAQGLQVAYLWKDDFIKEMKEQLKASIWIFGLNKSTTPFCTSDHPSLVKDVESKNWLVGPRIFDYGTYVVFPLTPTLILYCKEPNFWSKLKSFDGLVSPVKFEQHMVLHENSGQIGMSNRFIYSNENDFAFAKQYLNDNPEFKNPDRDRYE
jgi:hypothetical protein